MPCDLKGFSRFSSPNRKFMSDTAWRGYRRGLPYGRSQRTRLGVRLATAEEDPLRSPNSIPTRRTVFQGLATLAAAPALAQPSGPPTPAPFRYEDVIRRARELAGAAFEASAPALPEPLNRLDFDAYRDIRFRPDRALLGSTGGSFRMQLFHLGFLYQRPVTVNVIRDGVPTPIPYQRELFDYGRNKVERPLPVNLASTVFRLHYLPNNPQDFDYLIAFLGASYSHFL